MFDLSAPNTKKSRPPYPSFVCRTVALSSALLVGMLCLPPATLLAAPSDAPAEQNSRPVVLTKWKAPEAPDGGLAPTIVVRLVVGTDGVVKQAEIPFKRPGLAAVEKIALDAARGFLFQPALQTGKPVESRITLTVPFKATSRVHELVVKGSDTIGATLMPAWSEMLKRTQPRTSVRVEALGSSTGFAGLLDGSADVAESSRLINAEELAFAEKLGIQLYEVFAGYDGIAVIVHPDSPLRDLELNKVAQIFSGHVTNWRELGGPDAPIRAIGRPGYSGTHTFFKDRVLGDAGFGANVKSIEKTDDIVDAVAKDVTAIGYVGLGHVNASVKALALRPEAGATAVSPVASAIRDGSYPIARPLLLYLRSDSGHDARTLVDLALSKPGQALVEKNGFVAMSGSAGTFASEQAAPAVAKPEVIRIYFENNSTQVAHDSKLDVMQAALAVRAKRPVLVIGNADSTGKIEDNRRLAKQRADVVAAKLREYAGRDASIQVEVAATDHPLATNTTSDGRHANRRVDVIVLKDSAAAKPSAPTETPRRDPPTDVSLKLPARSDSAPVQTH